MPTPSFEQIILLMIFILAPLINFVMQRVRRRLEHHIPREESVTQMRRQPQATPPPSPVPREARERPPSRAQAPTVSAPLRRGRFIKRSLLGDIRGVRRGIILMTVLGPCRAFDPPD
jgi:hypothetical protein